MRALPSRPRIRRTCIDRSALLTIWRTRLLGKKNVVSRKRTLQYDKVMFILEPSEPAKAAIGKYVIVFDYPDGRLAIRYNGVDLAYRTPTSTAEE
jgi:hypothetical protein